MLKAILKKQFLELNQAYFRNMKTGKNRGKGGTIAFIGLFILIFFSLGFFFYEIAGVLCSGMVAAGLNWLYFSMMGILAIFLGIFGSVFNTYAGLYKAKDNELLLSMPIPTSYILFARTLGVFAMSLLYSAIVWIPAVLQYWVTADHSPACVAFCILLILVLSLLITVLTCLLGWVVAQIAGRVKKKSFITVLASLLFFALYYFFYFKLNSFIQNAVANASSIGEAMKARALPLYWLGNAAAGQGLSMLLFTILCSALFVLACYIMSRSFLKLAGEGKQAKTKAYTHGELKSSGLDAALLKKEFRRFGASPTYMLNGALGVVFLIAIAVAAVVKGAAIRGLVGSMTEIFPNPVAMAAVLAACGISLITDMDAISAPSVSLEGKNLWVLQSLPVPADRVLKAKQRLHIIVNLIPAIIALVTVELVIGADILSLLAALLFVAVSVLFQAALGLLLDLKRPNLNWTNEAVPIKQNLSVLFVMLLGWLIGCGCAAACYFLGWLLDVRLTMFVFSLLVGGLALLLRRWIAQKGAERFARL